MNKILFVTDGDNFPKGAFRFIKLLNENEPVFVKAIFFTPIDSEQLLSASFSPNADAFADLKNEEKRHLVESKERFSALCEDYGIKYHIHDNEQEWNKELFIKESRFADLAVISEELFCTNTYDQQPNSFMHEALQKSECAVVVVPEIFEGLDMLVISYDGKPECMLALKQFTYLMPQFTDLPADFVYASDDDTDNLPDKSLLQEYVSHHFNSLTASKLNFDPKKYFSTWLKDKRNTMLVVGSYSRSAISNFLKKSFADDIIHDHTNPVFIAHSI